MALVSRDPFAREELHRERVYTKRACAWCGQHKSTPGGSSYLYCYRVESDGGRKYEDDKLFCSTSCRGAYRS